jgi:hypothetical protein
MHASSDFCTFCAGSMIQVDWTALLLYKKMEQHETCCHAQLLAVTIRAIWLVGFSVEVVLPSLVQ